MKKLCLTLYILLFISGLLSLGRGLIIPAKAYLSVHLLNYAWHKTKTDEPSRPWPWLDALPIARLTIPSQHKDFIVLNSISPQALAFSPGWHPQTARPGQSGTTLLSAHNETHFKSLEKLKYGDVLQLETDTGIRHDYRVVRYFVTKTPQIKLLTQKNEHAKDLLILSTCYKDNLTDVRTQKRYILIAERA